MNPLVKKEIRLLLPAWIVAMLLAIVPIALSIAWSIVSIENNPADPWREYVNNSPMLFFAPFIFIFVGVLFLGINSFGQEMSSGTFTTLLAQPMERRRVWLVKIATLAIAYVLVWLTALILVCWQFNILEQADFWQAESMKSFALEFLTLSALVTFSGGLWTTLLLRQTTGAFWFTLLTPLAIILGINVALENWMAAGHNINAIVVVALILYSVAGFLWARWLFMRAQDLQWSGGEVSFPWRKKISEIKTASVPTRPRSWLFALVWKEIQLHQSSFVITVLVLALHLASFFIRKFHVHIENPDLQFVLQVIWILWLLMPLLIGATAIAEERRMGTAEAQLCLPVSRHTQLFLKFFIALLLSLFFGGFIPWLVEGVGTVTNWIFPIVAAIFFVSFYASSLARTTLQAIGLTILFVVFIYSYAAAIGIARTQFYANPLFGLILLKRYIGAFILGLVLGYLTSWNFTRQHQNWKFWTFNISSILAAIVFSFILANAIYFRAWELLLPREPRGPVRITSPSQVKFGVEGGGVIHAILPDGRLWVEPLAYHQVPEFSTPHQAYSALAPGLSHGQFIGGSNWVDVAVDIFQTLGIKSDGTLWRFHSSRTFWQFFPKGQTAPFSVALTQIGSDTNWSQAAGGQNGFLLLKKDGSLWSWGTHRVEVHDRTSNLPEKLKLDWASLPYRLSDDTNWTRLFSSDFLAYARKSNGNNWMLMGNHIALETNVDSQWSSLTFSPDLSYLEVKTNGELWLCYSSEAEVSNHNPLGYIVKTFRKIPEKIQFEPNFKWKTASFGQVYYVLSIMAIRSDGTLWDFPVNWNAQIQYQITPYQLSTRSDWTAVMSGFALASDGSVWVWGLPSEHIWLAPPRGPASLGNIFQSSSSSP